MYWELYQKKEVKFKEYMYIVFTSFILFSSSIKLKTCLYVFPPSSPAIKRNLIYFRCTTHPCLASPTNFIHGRVLAKVLSHVTIMPVLLRPVNNFLGQVIGNVSEGKYNTVSSSSSGEVTFQKCLKSGITLFSSENSNKSQTFATGAYQRLHEARPRRVVWLW